ncbi:hypothetical protein K1T71_003874 [Dendrolimus kikuchii]|uniref:Uncharacterized protein n=1 Tax=Dendrolimus kikuchii TaxID=765133 RepID=A0ACC1D9G6_9NEOP|nr:hypothetical protein K1T71_003874 [Dendrolimus kikuchii]
MDHIHIHLLMFHENRIFVCKCNNFVVMMSEVLKELVAKRGSLKGIITRLLVFILSDALEEANKAQLEVRLLRLQKTFSDLEDINNKISLLDPTDKEDISVFEDKFYEISAVLSERIERDKNVPRSQSNNHHRDIALPTIKIDPFDGKSCSGVYGDRYSQCIST